MGQTYKQEKLKTKRVLYTGSDALLVGYALCYDRDTGTASEVDKDRITKVEKPSASNLDRFAGIVAQKVPSGQPASQEQWITIIVPEAGQVIDLYTDQNCTQLTTKLSVVADQYELGGEGEGRVVAMALQTVDRSSTSGRVQGLLAPFNELGPNVSGSQTVTPNNDSGTGSTILPSSTCVDVAAVTNDANDWVVLPSLSAVRNGHEITILCNAGGAFEIRTPATSGEKINNVDSDGTNELAAVDTEIIKIIKVSNTDGWVARSFTLAGADNTALVPN